MTLFVIAALVLAGIALLWILPPLLRRHEVLAADAGDANLLVLRDQFAELERDAANGLLSAEQLASAREDLERRVLEDAQSGVPALHWGSSRKLAIGMAIALPVLAAGLYWTLGNPAAIALNPGQNEPRMSAEQIEGMLKKLEARLQQTPDDGKGWSMLARSYLVLQRYPEAVTAYGKAATLITNDADLLADYADALAMAQGRRIDGKALQLVEQALRVDPTQWKALAMSGAAAFERKEYRKAIAFWEKLDKREGLDPEFLRSISASIDEAKQLAGGKAAPRQAETPAPAAAVSAGGVRGTVRLDAALAAKAAPTDTVFIFARATQGPRAPLAVIRKQVKDLPYEFKLDDSLAMAPDLKLSKFSEVVVGARVSKTANAMPQSGDLQGLSKPVRSDAAGVTVVIDSTRP